jgi:RHS repeat-associated protein
MEGADGVGGMLATCMAGDWYFPLTDANGNITAYVNEQGVIVAEYVYDAFGATIAASGPMCNIFRHRFSTKYYDSEAWLYYYGYRFYDPIMHRWLNRDPIEEDGGLNLYAFCGNNGVNRIDLHGEIPIDTIWDLANIVYDICVGDDVALAADIAALAIPYVPAGTTRLVKAARLSQVTKICTGAKEIKVTYKYLKTSEYGFRHTLAKSAAANTSWIRYTKGAKKPSKFMPGWGDTEIQGVIENALLTAKKQGKIKPLDLDNFVYDVGKPVGAARGKITSKIRIHINPDGTGLHAFPD